MAPVYVFRFFLFSQLVLLLLAGGGIGKQGKCSSSFHCGSLGTIYFPFTTKEHQDCGLLAIQGCDDPSSRKMIQLEKDGRFFEVIEVSQQNNSITILDKDLQKLLLSRSCKIFRNNFTLPLTSPMASFHIRHIRTFYRCDRTLNISPPPSASNYTCPHYHIYHYHKFQKINGSFMTSSLNCSIFQLPGYAWCDTPQKEGQDLFNRLSANISIEVRIYDDCYSCHYQRGGQCRLDRKGSFFCAQDDNKSWGTLRLGLGLVSAAVGVGVLLIVIYCYRCKLAGIFWKNKSKAHQAFEAFLKSHGPLAVRRYSYSDIKKMTNSFKEKLGQGGYGGVFKGKLDDGCLVAVKILTKSEGNGEEFINEVASISRTSHVNIVTLLGFCFEGSKRALIYEFMPNGSLEKFIYETNPSLGNHQLNSEILYQIAIGVARGLEYLHRGCNTQILHFDIKPHNILLDENFCPKISDFGLAKICPRKESIVSMLVARGTIGYIAPEIFNRHFGGVSHKSDVYSYGMMILEMVGGKKNINVEVDHISEIYFPHWIYKRLKLNEEFALRNITNDNDKDRTRKMVIVSLWCIQIDPVDRPTMGRVVEMLEGRVETLQIPPKPFLSSPPRSPPTSSTY